MEALKNACKEVLEQAATIKVRFPKTWEGEEATKLKMKAAFDMLNATDKLEDGSYDVKAVLAKLEERYGVEGGNKRKAGEEEEEGGEASKEQVVKDENDASDNDDEGAPKKAKKAKKPKITPEEEKKSNIYTFEENKPFGEVLKEIASIYYKASEPRKAGVFSKAAKAFREAENAVTTNKEAMALKGVGKGIAAYFTEFTEKGHVDKLEQLREGAV